MQRLTRWLRRYLPAEVGGTVGALLGAGLAVRFSGHPVAGALGGAWGETLAYYATMLARDVAGRDGRAVPLVVRDLILEFGPAEALDSLLLRPALMYLGLHDAPSPWLGLLGGKLAADLAFYVPTIVSYERQRAHSHTRSAVKEVSR